LTTRSFEVIKLQPYLSRGARLDPRIRDVTVLNCLQHTGGWDRDKGFDPMGAAAAEEVARAFAVRLPITAEQIKRPAASSCSAFAGAAGQPPIARRASDPKPSAPPARRRRP
jgi:hypothetical protein